MISADGGRKMPCEGCGVQFSVFRRKRACSECDRQYCAQCLRRGGGMCVACRALCTRPLLRAAISGLKARDLQCFLHRQNVSTRGCVEKEELVSLCISHVNGPLYRRRGVAGGAGAGAGPGARGTAFSTLRGLTADINNFFSATFDLRAPFPASPQAHPQPHAANNCYNPAHAHAAAPPPPPSAAPPPHGERFTTNPGGEYDFRVPPPCAGAGGGERDSMSRSSSGAHADTADCFEVEDIDDGWELLAAPAEPLPGDSEVLLAASEQRLPPHPPARAASPERARPGPRLLAPSGGGAAAGGRRGEAESPGPSTPQRAASELELNRSEAGHTADSSSLQDEPIGYDNNERCQTESPLPRGEGGGRAEADVPLDGLGSEAALERLSVRALKRLLARNRVEYRHCLERDELLARARTLYREHAKYKDAVDALPIEECCKICMAAPLECVLLECGHIAACTHCAKQLAECPICRQYVVRAVRCFRS